MKLPRSIHRTAAGCCTALLLVSAGSLIRTDAAFAQGTAESYVKDAVLARLKKSFHNPELTRLVNDAGKTMAHCRYEDAQKRLEQLRSFRHEWPNKAELRRDEEALKTALSDLETFKDHCIRGLRPGHGYWLAHRPFQEVCGMGAVCDRFPASYFKRAALALAAARNAQDACKVESLGDALGELIAEAESLPKSIAAAKRRLDDPSSAARASVEIAEMTADRRTLREIETDIAAVGYAIAFWLSDASELEEVVRNSKTAYPEKEFPGMHKKVSEAIDRMRERCRQATPDHWEE
jgi:hypothetical protein